MKASWTHRRLLFKSPAGTSRGTLLHKDTWYIVLRDEEHLTIGECGMFRGLSYDDVPHYNDVLENLCYRINNGDIPHSTEYVDFPSIRFGLEVALGKMKSLHNGQKYLDSDFVNGKDSIAVNGLIWMGSRDSMVNQINAKLDAGYDCLKMKIGAIAWDDELSILKALRSEFTADRLTLRVDANGAFTHQVAPHILDELYRLDIHSIEQPIKAGQVEEMARLCESSPIPIALDEELIGVKHPSKIIESIRPRYIILKPTLLGGFDATSEWMDAAHKNDVGYWITSALESNVGLDAIARFTYLTQDINMPQGLGTGMLYHNNTPYPSTISHGRFSLHSPAMDDKEIYHTLVYKN